MTVPEISNNMLETPETISGQLMAKLQALADYFSNGTVDFLWNIFATIIIILLARFVLSLISFGTKSAMAKEKYHKTERQGKRIDTMMTLLRSVARYGIYFIAIMLVLRQFSLFEDMKGLVVTAGIGSLAIGFGAQNLVKDVVTGLFMMFENQFSVGDYIKTEEASGTVEATAMRVTYLRTFKGEQVIVPNGSISRVINLSRGDNVAVITVGICYESNTAKTLEVIDCAVQRYALEHPENIKDPPFVQGILSFAPSSIEIGVICKVHSMKQWEVERGMRLAIKEEFDRSGIQFPYPHIVTVPYSHTPHHTAIPDAVPQALPTATAIDLPNWVNSNEEDT